MWSARLVQSLRALGHVAQVLNAPAGEADMAIINLGEARAASLVESLKVLGVPVLAHAGHKETELLELGRSLGVDRLATNSELTHKLPSLLSQFEA